MWWEKLHKRGQSWRKLQLTSWRVERALCIRLCAVHTVSEDWKKHLEPVEQWFSMDSHSAPLSSSNPPAPNLATSVFIFSCHKWEALLAPRLKAVDAAKYPTKHRLASHNKELSSPKYQMLFPVSAAVENKGTWGITRCEVRLWWPWAITCRPYLKYTPVSFQR